MSNFHHQPGDFFRTVMTQYCSRWITARWWEYCANFCSLYSPSPSRSVRLPQGGCRINGIDGISLHLCSSLVICGCISLLLCLELDLPFLFLLSSHSPSLWHGFPLQHGPWGLSPTFHFATVFSCLLCTQLIHWLSLPQRGRAKTTEVGTVLSPPCSNPSAAVLCHNSPEEVTWLVMKI